MCVLVCLRVCVFAIIATPFNLELSSFGISGVSSLAPKAHVRHLFFFLKFYCFRTISRSICTFVPKGIPIGFQMAEKNANTETDRHFRIYISRDVHLAYDT